jgi:hypothetical protein
MELHETLYSLRWTIGQESFEDPDEFRAALDDFLDEGSLSSGQINLLVDAMRFGAYRRMMSMIESGAEPAAAVEAGGELLSRERGSADLGGSRWACAVLGYAAGKVPALDVQRFLPGTGGTSADGVPPHVGASAAGASSATTDRPPAAPTTTAPPGAFPPGAPTFAPHSQGSATGWSGQQSPQAGQPAGPWPTSGQSPRPDQPTGPWQSGGEWNQPGGPPPYWSTDPGAGPGGPPPKKPQNKVLLAAIAGVVAVVLLGSGVAFFVLNGNDEPSQPSGPKFPAAIESDAVNEKYEALGANVAASAQECAQQEPTAEVAHHVICEMPNGTLDLTTYESSTDLEAVREETVNFRPEVLYSEQEVGVFFSQRLRRVPTLYWDDGAELQSASYQARSGVGPGRLHAWFKDIDPPGIDFPASPENPDLVAFIERTGDHSCKREMTHTFQSGATEQNMCQGPSSWAWITHFDSERALKAFRRIYASFAQDNSSSPTTWNHDGGPTLGAYIAYHDFSDGGRPVVYFDDVICRCSAVAFGNDVSDYHDELATEWGFTG